ncbi:hypothetical protein Q7V72_03310 [Streptococcus suis]|nr:hypothetical protein [Streptococcus suis]HEM3878456.1 hypothetical protein [Streptococcus suis]HEM3895691.1 hypothetical protein [Streptococcus suis]HEM3903860.1 hypothetical protein [Streptococcus suis]
MTVVVKVKKMWHDLKEDKVRFIDDVFEMSDERFEEVDEKLPGYNEKISHNQVKHDNESQTEEETVEEPQVEEETVEVPEVEKPKGKRKTKVVAEENGKEE